MSRVTTFLLFAGFGLAPMWIATTVVIMGSKGASSEYWNAAPWLMFMAIPVCGVTLLIALVTHLIARREKDSSLPMMVVVAGLVISLALVWKYAPG